MNPNHILCPSLGKNKLAIYWLTNGLFALISAVIYSIILIFLAIPLGKNLWVVHINLSILVWFLSLTAAIWSYRLQTSNFTIIYIILAFFSTALIVFSPICEKNLPVMNKYIPICENIIFILGISLFGVVILLFAFYALYTLLWYDFTALHEGRAESKSRRALSNPAGKFISEEDKTLFPFSNSDNYPLIHFTILSTTILFILVWLCFTISYLKLREVIKLTEVSIEFYYELLLWSGSHLLQFIYSQILVLIWMILLSSLLSSLNRGKKFAKLCLALLYLNFVIALSAPLGHLLYNILEEGFKEYYEMLGYGRDIVPILTFMVMAYYLIRMRSNIQFTLRLILLLLLASAIGLLITAMNTIDIKIYHGCMVGVTVVTSLMVGVIYQR